MFLNHSCIFEILSLLCAQNIGIYWCRETDPAPIPTDLISVSGGEANPAPGLTHLKKGMLYQMPNKLNKSIQIFSPCPQKNLTSAILKSWSCPTISVRCRIHVVLKFDYGRLV